MEDIIIEVIDAKIEKNRWSFITDKGIKTTKEMAFHLDVAYNGLITKLRENSKENIVKYMNDRLFRIKHNIGVQLKIYWQEDKWLTSAIIRKASDCAPSEASRRAKRFGEGKISYDKALEKVTPLEWSTEKIATRADKLSSIPSPTSYEYDLLKKSSKGQCLPSLANSPHRRY